MAEQRTNEWGTDANVVTKIFIIIEIALFENRWRRRKRSGAYPRIYQRNSSSLSSLSWIFHLIGGIVEIIRTNDQRAWVTMHSAITRRMRIGHLLHHSSCAAAKRTGLRQRITCASPKRTHYTRADHSRQSRFRSREFRAMKRALAERVSRPGSARCISVRDYLCKRIRLRHVDTRLARRVSFSLHLEWRTMI